MDKILAIDDKKDNLFVVTNLLQNSIPGCAVITALSGEEGLDKAVSESPDVILLDIQMPGMDGFEACKRLKSSDKTKHIPVIMLTAIRTDAKSRIKGLEIGADAFLSKPVDQSELAAQVRVMLRIKRAEDKLRQERDQLNVMFENKTAELENKEIELEYLFENMIQGVVYYDNECRVIFANPSAERILGLSIDQMSGMACNDPSWKLMHLDLSRFKDDDHPAIMGLKSGKPVNSVIMGIYNRAQGEHKWVNKSAIPVFHNGQSSPYQVFTTFEDITGLIEAENIIKESLKEKEVLLMEIHHRVKNNMQVITGLLSLQRNRIQDKELVEIFKDSESRIKTMSLVHERIYNSKNFSEINFKEYCKNLTDELKRFYAIKNKNIKITLNLVNIFFGVDVAIPCALIINEIVSNSFKHAFSDMDEGEIIINCFKNDNEEFSLIISDNGKGFPHIEDIKNMKTLGITLIQLLVKQLKGKIDIESKNGMTFKILLKKDNKSAINN